MAAGEVRVGDIGTVFEVTVMDGASVVDLSSTITKEILLRGPRDALLTKVAAFKTDGTDGILQYTTIAGDLSEEGLWRIQAHVVFAAGDWNSDFGAFMVHGNL